MVCKRHFKRWSSGECEMRYRELSVNDKDQLIWIERSAEPYKWNKKDDGLTTRYKVVSSGCRVVTGEDRGSQAIVLDLSLERQKDVMSCGYRIDPKMMVECAHYPKMRPFIQHLGMRVKSKCESCSWEKPNEKCKHSYVLWIGRDEDKVKELGHKKSKMEMLLQQLSVTERKEFLDWVNRGDRAR